MSGISSITFSTPGQEPVTLDKNSGKRIRANIARAVASGEMDPAVGESMAGLAGMVTDDESPPDEPQVTNFDPDDPAVLANIVRQVEAREKECQERFAEWKDLAERAKDAKTEYDTAVLALRRAARAREERHPLFDKPEEQASTGDESWRTVPLAELGLQPKLTEKLVELGIETIGQLEDQRAGEGLGALQGIGPAKITLIEDAVTNWLARFYAGSSEAPNEATE